MRPLLQLMSPAGERARLSVLIFHRVLPVPDPLLPDEIDAARFEQTCTWARRWFNVLPLEQACRQLAERRLPPRAMSITFDDGYADNHDVAMPILRRHGLHATFFIATGFLDGGRMWNDTLIEAVRRTRLDRLELPGGEVPGVEALPVQTLPERRAAIDRLIKACRYLQAADRQRATEAVARAAAAELPRDLMMTSAQVVAMRRAGMALGGHTVTHPILARLPPQEAATEISAGKARLEALLDERVALFAYPNGRPDEDYRAEHARMVREAGFDAAVSTAWGAARSSNDLYQLPRFTPWDRSAWRYGLRLAGNLRNTGRLATAVRA